MKSLKLQTFISISLFLVKKSVLDAYLIKKPEASADSNLDFAGEDYLDYSIDYVAEMEDFMKPKDPATALKCTSFVCLLSKFDMMKTEQGYTMVNLEVIA